MRLASFVVVCALVLLIEAKCSDNPFGDAGNYAIFTAGALNFGSGSVDGGIAGGASVSVSDIAITTCTGNSISSGGAVTLRSGSAVGPVSGLSFDAQDFFITANGNTYAASNCCPDTSCTACQAGNSVDFSGIQTNLLATSSYWSSLATTGTIVSRWSVLTLTCNEDEQFNSFSNVDLTDVRSLIVKCSSSQTVVINYSGSSLTSMGFKNDGGASVIHHFTAASTQITNVKLDGIVFAPSSNVEVSAATINGALIANTVSTGNHGSHVEYKEFSGCAPSKAPLPNIVIFLADDLGYTDLSSYGAPDIVTPNIDKLVYGGKRLSSFYVTPMCSPTRAALLTGRLPIRSGCYNNATSADNPYNTPVPVFYPVSYGMLPSSEILISNLLDQVGYNNGLFGKWHLGTINDTALPLQRGFHRYWGMPYSSDMGCPPGVGYPCVPSAGPADTWVPVPLYDDNTIIEQPTTFGDFTSRLTAQAIDFIDESVTEGRPFFVNVNYVTVSILKIFYQTFSLIYFI